MSDAYRRAGVDIRSGHEAVERIKSHAESTHRPEVLGSLGSFGGMFELPQGYRRPVLVAGTDGVGTKLRLAFELDIHDTIGVDLVAMCANDVVVQGAEPLLFLDYLATSKVVPKKVEQIAAGIANGCRLAGCALIGGETAEMPGFYQREDYDLAGFCVGVVEKDDIVDGRAIEPGDVLIGLASSGLHSNGFSLVRRIAADAGRDQDRPFLKSLLTPTRIYVRPVLDLLSRFSIRGMSHITGGGLAENIPRMLPSGCGARLDADAWHVPEVFSWVKEAGKLSFADMIGTFNMGIGMVLCVAAGEAEAVLGSLEEQSLEAYSIGIVERGEGLSWKEPKQ